VRFGPFRLDIATGELHKRDRKIRLQQQPLEILVLLLEHAGDVVSRTDIRQRVWGKDTTVAFEHSIPTALKKLRQALGDSASRPRYVETLARRGYRWLEPVAWDALISRAPGRARLVGRSAPLATLREALRRAGERERQVVLIRGEPGIGKTALITEFEREAARTFSCARGQCIEEYGSTEAYYPVLEAIGELCRGSDPEPIIAILASHAPTWLVQFPALVSAQQRSMLQREILGATRERMLREMCDALDAIAIEHPLLLILEDLHWSDRWTIDLLSAIARRRAHTQLMVIGTFRPVDPATALNAARNDLLVHGLSREISLEPLSQSDVVDYLSDDPAMARWSAELAHVVHRRSEGNPLFMVAALDHLEGLGLIVRQGGALELRGSLEQIDIGVPETLRQMIEVQIERLSREEQKALEVASVVGTSFLTGVCAASLGAEPEALESLYETLSTRHHIVRDAGGQRADREEMLSRYEFVHELYREVLYQRQPAGRRSRLHRRIGLELEHLTSQQPIELADAAPELAHHFEVCGDWRRAATYLGMMADAAGRRCVPRDAIALLQRALELVARLPDAKRATIELELLRKLATASVVSFDTRAVQVYRAMISRAEHYRSVMGEIHGLIGMAYPASWVSAKPCLEAIERAMALTETVSDPVLRARLRASCLVRRIWAGGWSEHDAADCREALNVIRSAGDRRVLAKHLIDCNFIHWASSEYRVARQDAVESLAILVERAEDNPYLSFPYWLSQFILPWSLLFLGEWGEMLRELDEGLGIARKNGDDFRAQTLRLYQAWLYVDAMDFAEVITVCESILPALDKPERTPWRRLCLVLAGCAHTALGNEPRALDHLIRVDTEMTSQTVIHDWYTRIMLEAALTNLSLLRTDIVRARLHANRFLEATLATAERTWQALAWEASARVANADLDLERSRQCIAHAIESMKGFDTPLAAWRVHATAADLARLTGRNEESAHHRDLSRATVLQLANSLPADHHLRTTFLTSYAVSRVISDGQPA
jgi:DNA-binding winged helix-turn-helix (wHTH) protein